MTHAPLAQSSTALARPQVTPHAPQFISETLVFVSHPFAAMPSQLAKPVLHVPSVHTLPTQVAPALVNEHALPHAPQLAALFVVFVSQPATMALQSPVPAGHMPVAHAPALQIAPAPGQAVPHMPQFVGLTATFVSHPLDAMPSQLA